MSIAVCAILGPLLSHLIQQSRSISSLTRFRWSVVENLNLQIIKRTFWYFILVFRLHVPLAPVNSYVSLILALTRAIIQGLTLCFFLLLFTSLYLICTIYILFLCCIYILLIFASDFAISVSFLVICLPLISFAILSVFRRLRLGLRSLWQIRVFDLHFTILNKWLIKIGRKNSL
jgi:hypothetical protein